jgi:SH3-like domain-containing protein
LSADAEISIICRSIGIGAEPVLMSEPPTRCRYRRCLALMVALAVAPLAAGAQNPAAPDKVPRFVSLRSDQVNLRVGPGETYPIEWVLTRKDMPVEIVKEFQNWRMIRDWQDTKGWVLDRMVTGKRNVVVTGQIRALHRRPDPDSAVVARAEPGVVARLAECQGPWCRIEAGGYSGWVRRSEVWGVLPDETVP